MVKSATVGITVVVNGADECQRITGLIGDHYRTISDLYGELAAMREKDEPTGITGCCDVCRISLFTPFCPQCGKGAVDHLEAVKKQPPTHKDAGTCPYGCGHDLRLDDFLDFDAITEASVWSCPGCERAIRVLNHGGSVFEAVATSDPVTDGAWYSDAKRTDDDSTAQTG